MGLLEIAIAVSLAGDIAGAAKPGCTWTTKAIPRIPASQLSVEQFVRDFVRPGLPLIIEAPLDKPWSFQSVVQRCFPDAQIPVAVREAAAAGDRWARLNFIGSKPLSEFTEYMRAGDEAGPSARPIYGFDLNLAHECPMLLESFAVPKYFSPYRAAAVAEPRVAPIPTASTTYRPVVMMCRALHPCDAEQSDELSFRAGDVVECSLFNGPFAGHGEALSRQILWRRWTRPRPRDGPSRTSWSCPVLSHSSFSPANLDDPRDNPVQTACLIPEMLRAADEQRRSSDCL